MTAQEFTLAAHEVAEFLGVPSPPANRIMAWLPKVQHIPAEAIRYIVGKITDEADSMPRNLPKVFRAAFDSWLKNRPGKMAHEAEQAGCRDCEAGILHLIRGNSDTGHIETCAVFCSCYTGHAGYVGRASLAAMQAKGWQSRKTEAKSHHALAAHRESIQAYIAGAIQADANPDYQRKDLYGDAYEQEASWA